MDESTESSDGSLGEFDLLMQAVDDEEAEFRDIESELDQLAIAQIENLKREIR